MKKLFRTFLMATMAAAVVLSCDKEPHPTPTPVVPSDNDEQQTAAEKAQKYLKDEIMKEYYYWYDQMGEATVNAKTDIYKFFNKLLYRKDRWSWMMDGQEYLEDESGVISGTYGGSFGQPRDDFDDYNVYVRYVYPNSPLAEAGVKRGWMINKIDGKYVVKPDEDFTGDFWLKDDANVKAFNKLLSYPSTTIAHDFEFLDNDRNPVTVSLLAAETLMTRPGLIKRIFTAEDYPGLTQPVGYFLYLGFKADNDINGKSMLEDITEAMAYFKANNVKTLILDLRYNGGGDSRASDLLVSYLAPESAYGQTYVTRTHNKKLRSQDKSQQINSPLEVIDLLESNYDDIRFNCKSESPLFEHLYFITGKGSASASEMSLNGLKPLANLTHVGDTTYGKPNGMYVFLYPYDKKAQALYNKNDYSKLEYVFLPICFYNANGIGQNIPDEGIIPDNTRPDDVYHDFGVNEDNIAACLYNIVNGGFPAAPVRTKASGSSYYGPRVILKLNREDYDENYGSYIVKPDFL